MDWNGDPYNSESLRNFEQLCAGLMRRGRIDYEQYEDAVCAYIENNFGPFVTGLEVEFVPEQNTQE